MRDRSSISGIDPWRTLEALSFYRATVCVALLTLSASDYRPPYFGGAHAALIDATLYIYLFLAALLLIMVRGQRPTVPWQTAIQISADMGVILLLFYAAGGGDSGLGALLVTPVTAGSLLLSRRGSIVPPAFATIALLSIEVFLNLQTLDFRENYAQTGILGAGLFIIAITGGALARRARDSEIKVSQAQSDLAKLAMLSESVIQKLQAGVIVTDAQGSIELLNRAAKQMLGAGAAPRRHLSACAPTVWQKLTHWKLDPAGLTNSALSLPNNHAAWAQFTRLGGGNTASTLIVLDDASRVSEQAQSMKLASLGRLTASIAHELRNPLAAIQHAAELASESAPLSENDRPLLDIVQRQAHRVGDIITSVLSLSRKPQITAAAVNLKEIVDTCVQDFLQGGAHPPPRVHASVKPTNIAVHVEPIQLIQILGNLLENARTHAFVAEKQLEISIDARISTDGNLVLIDIRDNGPGIPADVAANVFEPFFSTHHLGTGLGLFITRELCDAAHGDLQLVKADKDHAGAYFRLSFPATLMNA